MVERDLSRGLVDHTEDGGLTTQICVFFFFFKYSSSSLSHRKANQWWQLYIKEAVEPTDMLMFENTFLNGMRGSLITMICLILITLLTQQYFCHTLYFYKCFTIHSLIQSNYRKRGHRGDKETKTEVICWNLSSYQTIPRLEFRPPGSNLVLSFLAKDNTAFRFQNNII